MVVLPLENVVKEPLVAKQQIEEEQQVILELEMPQLNVGKLQPQVEAAVLKWGYVGLTLLVVVVQRLLQREEQQ